MTRMSGSAVTIGSSVNNNYLYVDFTVSSQDVAGNYSVISWAVGFHYTSSDAQLTAGSAALGGATRWSNSGTAHSYGGDFTTRDLQLATGSFNYAHNTDGTATLAVSGSITVYGSGTSSGSASYALPTIPRAPGVPGTPSASGYNDSTPTTVTISWTAPSNVGAGLEQRQLQIATSSSFSSTVVNSTESWSTSYNASGLSYGTTYYTRVRAINDAGDSDWSPVASFTTGAATPTAPGTPTASGYNDADPSTVTISWSAPSYVGPGATQRQVQVGTDSGFGSPLVDDTASWSTSYPATGLGFNTTYYTRIRAYNSAGGWGPWSTTTSFTTSKTTAAAPGTPTASAVTYTTMTIAWTAPPSTGGDPITGYVLERATNSGFSANLTTVSGITVTSYAVTGLATGTTYYLRVRAVTAQGQGTNSGTLSQATVAASAPTAPGTPTFAAVTGTSVQVSWTAPASDNGAAITGYTLEISTDGSTFATKASGITALTVAAGGLDFGVTYWFRVRALNTAGTSAPSTPASVTTGTTTPGPPGTPTISLITQTSARITFTTPAGDGGSPITGYDIQRATDPGFTTNVAGASGTSPVDLTGFAPATTYYVRVRARNANGAGDWSTAATFTTLAALYLFNGAAFVGCQLLVWRGNAWIACTTQRWNGSTWV